MRGSELAFIMKTKKEDEKMDTLLIFDGILAALGAYLAFAALRMKRTGEVNAFLVSGEERGKCTDPAGFIERVYKRMAAFGGVAFLYGVVGVAGRRTHMLSRQAETAAGIVFLASCAWFAYGLRKGKEGFFR